MLLVLLQFLPPEADRHGAQTLVHPQVVPVLWGQSTGGKEMTPPRSSLRFQQTQTLLSKAQLQARPRIISYTNLKFDLGLERKVTCRVRKSQSEKKNLFCVYELHLFN